jgi:hypothetical protein
MRWTNTALLVPLVFQPKTTGFPLFSINFDIRLQSWNEGLILVIDS